jgi:adenylosuccinate synthase
MLEDFCQEGKASFIIGGQMGSEGKGAVAAWVSKVLTERNQLFDVYTCNAGAQAGHTSIHNGVKRVAFHLPTAALIPPAYGSIYINAGAIIDVDILMQEIKENNIDPSRINIHPNAAIITPECKDEEMDSFSSTTFIASTRKGVGAALARKVMRSGLIARDEPRLKGFIHVLDLNWHLVRGLRVLVEVPQGISLSLNSRFYPHVTSRNCTIQQAMADAGIHPFFYGKTIMALRTYPIRVGNLDGNSSGDGYPDQTEISWGSLGQTPEITTVTKRVRRVFTPSRQQIYESMEKTRPQYVFISFCDYGGVKEIKNYVVDAAERLYLKCPEFIYGFGPTTDDVETGEVNE